MSYKRSPSARLRLRKPRIDNDDLFVGSLLYWGARVDLTQRDWNQLKKRGKEVFVLFSRPSPFWSRERTRARISFSYARSLLSSIPIYWINKQGQEELQLLTVASFLSFWELCIRSLGGNTWSGVCAPLRHKPWHRHPLTFLVDFFHAKPHRVTVYFCQLVNERVRRRRRQTCLLHHHWFIGSDLGSAAQPFKRFKQGRIFFFSILRYSID